jgi:adenosylmethionine-8-amino-7-oxononanoate aminotransferase
VFRPYTGTEEHEAESSIVTVSAEGPFLVDADGRRFFDASGAWWTNHLGYQHPRLVRAIETQARTLAHAPLAGATHAQAALLAEELVGIAKGMARAFYSDDGSTAVEVAVKLTYQLFAQNGAPERTRFLALPSGYHGDTIGAMSLGALDAFTQVHGPLLFDVTRAPEPDAVRGFDRTFDFLCAELERDGARIAGVFVEPLVQGAAGMRMYAPSQLARLAESTRKAGALLVLDEVFTGFGRTGTMFAYEQAGIVPDVLCLSKGLAGGMMPFAATLVTERVYDGFRGDKRRALMHGHTFCGNPLGAALAREVLRVYAEEDVIARARAGMARLAGRVQGIGLHAGVRNARALGMIGAFEGERGLAAPPREHDLSRAALDHGRGRSHHDARRGGGRDGPHARDVTRCVVPSHTHSRARTRESTSARHGLVRRSSRSTARPAAPRDAC